jgi:hypothetical protein
MSDPKERRKQPRIGCDMPMSFSLAIGEFTSLDIVEACGEIVDSSEQGLGLKTDYRLKPGQLIRIKKEGDSFVSASVRWVGEIEGGCRVGVLFYK